jgi:hypothetical protein
MVGSLLEELMKRACTEKAQMGDLGPRQKLVFLVPKPVTLNSGEDAMQLRNQLLDRIVVA